MGLYPGLEDEDQLGQPPASVPDGDPRAGLYAYLAQQAANRQQNASVPSYGQLQQGSEDASRAAVRNQLAATLQNSASMMGTLNGKRSDYSGPEEMAKTIAGADQSDLKNQYQVLAQRNRDAATEGTVFKDLSNPDVARSRLYANLLARADAEKGRNDRNDKNINSREKIADNKIDAMPETNGSWSTVYPQDNGTPYKINAKTGEMKPLDKGFESKKDKANADPNADEVLEKSDKPRWDKLMDATDPTNKRSGDFAAQQKSISSADKILNIEPQAAAQKGGLDSRQIEEIAIGSAALVSGGNGAAQATVHALVPHSIGREQAAIIEWLTNEPQGANQQAFVRRMFDTAKREKHGAIQKQNETITGKMQDASDMRDKYPKKWDNSYYRKVGDDAAYDEQGRYISEPFDEKAPPALRPGQSPISLTPEPAAPQKQGDGFGPAADPGQYARDLKDAEWAKAHHMPIDKAKAFLDMRNPNRG